MDPQNAMNASNDQANEQPWLFPAKGESNTWFDRFSRYLALGPARTVNAAFASESKKLVKVRKSSSLRASSAWYDASRRFDWAKRAQAHDTWQRQVQFSTGNAADTERVRKLDELAEQMYTKLMAELDSLPVNEKFIERYLSVMDRLAKNTGGYAPQRLEHTGKNGGKIEVEETQVNVVFYMPEIDTDALNNDFIEEQPAETLLTE